MYKSFKMYRADSKETKHCFRYERLDGDDLIQTVYIKKALVDDRGAPDKIEITVSDVFEPSTLGELVGD